jgi:hypothetical protein
MVPVVFGSVNQSQSVGAVAVPELIGRLPATLELRSWIFFGMWGFSPDRFRFDPPGEAEGSPLPGRWIPAAAADRARAGRPLPGRE